MSASKLLQDNKHMMSDYKYKYWYRRYDCCVYKMYFYNRFCKKMYEREMERVRQCKP